MWTAALCKECAEQYHCKGTAIGTGFTIFEMIPGPGADVDLRSRPLCQRSGLWVLGWICVLTARKSVQTD